jgi:hypothetical protein
MPTRVKQKPQIRDLIADDARCVALEGFRIYPIGREIAKGEYLKLIDAVVRQHPTFFALVIPVNDVLSGEIER